MPPPEGHILLRSLTGACLALAALGAVVAVPDARGTALSPLIAPPVAQAPASLTDDQLAASLAALEHDAALHARRLGLRAPELPPRPGPRADPVQHSERLGQVVGFLRARREHAPAIERPAPPATGDGGSSVERAHVRLARQSARVGIVPPPPPRPAPDPATRTRQAQGLAVMAGWLARQSERTRPAERNAAAAAIALAQRGAPYVWGGAGPGGFDCSGLAAYAFAQVGVSLPHNTNAIWDAHRQVRRADLLPGDLVFFNGLGHMGIYLGADRFVHAPSSGDVVTVIRLSERDDYVGAVRP